MKTLNLFGLLVAAACTFQACHSPESRAAKSDSSSTDSNSTAMNSGSDSTGATSPGTDKVNPSSTGKMDAASTANSSNTSGPSNTMTSSAPDKMSTVSSKTTSGPKDVTLQSHVDGDEATFMKEAATGGMMEVDLGKIAQKSTNPEVKAFALQMITDHSKVNAELKALAAKSGIILPSAYPSDEKAHMEAMRKMTGADFDKHYIGMMVTGHDKTLTLFRNGANAQDKEVRDFAKKTLPVITGHFKKAKAIQAELK
ncbi:MAG TPA: DUF4142 domain-containing protein [Pedobacter sp.]